MGLFGFGRKKTHQNTGSNPQPAMQKKYGDTEHIRCPYCFTEFKHYQVHFRVDEMSIRNDIDRTYYTPSFKSII